MLLISAHLAQAPKEEMWVEGINLPAHCNALAG
jgi:hypothetical protein